MSPFNLLILVLVVALLIYAVILGQIRPKLIAKPLNRQLVELRWATVEAMLAKGGLGLRSAVLEADKLLDYVMRQRGFSGKTMADRLRVAESKLSNRNAVWRAHKLRNTLAHEVGADLVASQAKDAIADYRRAIKDLGGL